jgi:hypothetical protein
MTAMEDLDVAIERYHESADEIVKGNAEPSHLRLRMRDGLRLARPHRPLE